MSKYGHKAHNWFEAVINKMGGEDRAEAFLRGELVLSEVAQTLLRYVGTSAVAALTSVFFVVSHLQKNLTNNAKVKISYVDPDIATWLPATVPSRKAHSLKWHDLTKNADDTTITKVLDKNYEVDMAVVWEKMAQQPNGEAGDLFTNGYASLFYVGGCVVCVHWFSGGWGVDVRRLNYVDYWCAANRVFSRNSETL